MSVELTPVGMKCQLACDYCYETRCATPATCRRGMT